MEQKINNWITTAIWTVVGIIATIVITHIYHNLPQKPPLSEDVILLGSGTVKNYLGENLGSDIFKKAPFFSGPSNTAIDLLLSAKEGNSKGLPLIIMSSTKLTPNKYKTSNYKEKVYEFELLRDTLMVAIFQKDNNSIIKRIGLKKESTSINVNQLRDLLNIPMYYNLYLTTLESGTLKEFNKLLTNKEDSIFNWESLKRANRGIFDISEKKKI
jgi:hypothetical protein